VEPSSGEGLDLPQGFPGRIARGCRGSREAEAPGRIRRLIADAARLLILCLLVVRGAINVTSFVGEIERSQSVLSQHLAKLCEDGRVAFRRGSQTIHYRLEDLRAARVLATLEDIFCPDLG
jgi:DNA-binding transcriptional ArsR family regulator